MLEQRAVHMTEEEIDAYYRQRREEALKRYYAIQANRAIREGREAARAVDESLMGYTNLSVQ